MNIWPNSPRLGTVASERQSHSCECFSIVKLTTELIIIVLFSAGSHLFLNLMLLLCCRAAEEISGLTPIFGSMLIEATARKVKKFLGRGYSSSHEVRQIVSRQAKTSSTCELLKLRPAGTLRLTIWRHAYVSRIIRRGLNLRRVFECRPPVLKTRKHSTSLGRQYMVVFGADSWLLI